MSKPTLQNPEPLHVVYMITCKITGKSYIGQTVSGLRKRLNRHIRDAETGSNFHFHNALRLYGEDAFTSTILYVSFEKDSKHLKVIEKQLIADYDTFHNGYNMTLGLNTTSIRVTWVECYEVHVEL